jgi:flagellar FliL protein
MGKKAKANPAGDEAAEKSGGGMKLVPVIVLSLALVTAGYFVGGRGGGAAPAAEAAVPTTVPEPVVDHIVDLEAINVNLSDGHYLRVAVSLGLAAAEAGGGEGAEAEFPTAPAADFVLGTFSGRSVDELSTLDGRAAARQELEQQLQEYYGEEELVTIFFTEFVMQ